MKPVRNDSIIILVCLIAIAAFLIGKKVGSKEDYTEVSPYFELSTFNFKL